MAAEYEGGSRVIAVIDVGISNLHSALGGLNRAGAEIVTVRDGATLLQFVNANASLSGVVLPGVGTYEDAMEQLENTEMLGALHQVVQTEIPLFGICLGMQLLFQISEENGRHRGLGYLEGEVVRFQSGAEKVPHMGWNELTCDVPSHPLLQGVLPQDYVYFVHSYYAVPAKPSDIVASTTYAGVKVPALVGKNFVMGAQFHPEKSGMVGEQILRNFVAICKAKRVAMGVTL